MILDRLMELQASLGHVPREEFHALARQARVPLYRLYGLVSFYPHLRLEPPEQTTIHLCRDAACWLRGAPDLEERLRKHLATSGEPGSVRTCSCLGLCDQAPAWEIEPGPDPAETERIRDSLAPLLPRLAPPVEPETLESDPYSDGSEPYQALRRIVESPDPDGTIRELEASGLRGLGGAGFPTGLKWRLTRRELGEPKVAICNADESEPGTFKDRFLLEQAPHLVWEGLALAALTVGADRGVVFLREEYRKGRESMQAELDSLLARPELAGLLGGSDPDLTLELAISPGGYICGEETGLLEALEGSRAEPRTKPPFPAGHGLHGRPTLINNVETLAMVPAILLRGADWWTRQGRGEARGLKLLALSGHVESPGVYEVPLGLPLTELIHRAGGMLEGRELMAFCPGGASAPLLPASEASVPLDFEALDQAGSMLGSGAVLILARGTDLLALALNVSRFFQGESCGKCVPCRVGCRKLVELLERIQTGQGAAPDLEVIQELAATMADGSICGLGQAAPNLARSVLEHFPAQIHRHLRPGDDRDR